MELQRTLDITEEASHVCSVVHKHAQLTGNTCNARTAIHRVMYMYDILSLNALESD